MTRYGWLRFSKLGGGLCRTNGTFASGTRKHKPVENQMFTSDDPFTLQPWFGNASYDYKNLGRHLAANSPGHQDLSVVNATTPLTKTHFT